MALYKILLLSLLSLALTAFQTARQAVPVRIKTVTAHLSGNVSEYRYTKDWHIAAISSSRGNNATYRYEPPLVIKEMNNSKTNEHSIDTFWLDGTGLATNFVINTGPRTYYTSESDADKHTTKLTLSYNEVVQATYEYTYTNSNQVAFRFADDRGQTISRETYTHYSDTLNTTGYENMGMDFMGHSSKYALKTSTMKTIGGQKTCYYHLDAKGRIAIKAEYNGKGKLLDSTSYTYY